MLLNLVEEAEAEVEVEATLAAALHWRASLEPQMTTCYLICANSYSCSGVGVGATTNCYRECRLLTQLGSCLLENSCGYKIDLNIQTFKHKLRVVAGQVRDKQCDNRATGPASTLASQQLQLPQL